MMDFLSRWLTPVKPVVEIARARDAPALALLHAAAFRRGWSEQEFERLLTERNTLAHRLRLAKKSEGFIVSRIAADEAEILSITVAKAQRGRGLALKLLMPHLGQLAGMGVRAVFLEVEEANQAARRLYARAGFRDVGRREGYYQAPDGDTAAAVTMRRDIG